MSSNCQECRLQTSIIGQQSFVFLSALDKQPVISSAWQQSIAELVQEVIDISVTVSDFEKKSTNVRFDLFTYYTRDSMYSTSVRSVRLSVRHTRESVKTVHEAIAKFSPSAPW